MLHAGQRPQIAVVGSSSFGKDFPEHLERLNAFADVHVFSIPKEQNDDPRAIARNESEASLIAKLQPYHGIIASVDPVYSAEVLQKLNNLAVIARHGIGYNNVAFNEALALGIVVTKVEGWVEQASVAELAVGLALAASRKIVDGHTAIVGVDDVKAGWEKRKGYSGPEIAGRTVGVLGCGNIGTGAARIFKTMVDLAPGGRVLVCDPYQDAASLRAQGFEVVDKETLVKESDFISLHSLLNAETKHLLGAKEFAAMKEGAIIINTARGGLVDEVALAPYLNAGGKLFYAADVFGKEPIDPSNPLLAATNIVLTPHLGGYGNSSKKGMGDACVGAMEMVLRDGQVPVSVPNPRGQAVGCLVPEHMAAHENGLANYRFTRND